MKEPLATIDEPGGFRLDIFEEEQHGIVGYNAERTAPDGTVTTPQTGMTPEECIRYLSHLANGLAYEAGQRR